MGLTSLPRQSTPGPREPTLASDPSLPVVHGAGAPLPESVAEGVFPVAR